MNQNPVGNSNAEEELYSIADRNTGLGETIEESEQRMASGRSTTGGDRDANQYQAKVAGEEAIGGLTPTPDQDNVDEIADSVGVELSDSEPVLMTAKLEERDENRWELDRDSTEER